MKVRVDFKDVEAYIEQGRAEVAETLDRIGEEGESINRSSTGYHDVTGNLRASNWHRATPDTLEIGNSAPYASDVQRRGNVAADGYTHCAIRVREEFL